MLLIRQPLPYGYGMSETPWLDEDEARLWRTWLRLNSELLSALGSELQRNSGLSDADYAILVPLSESEGGALRSGDLRERIYWDRSRLSHQIRRMEGRGLLTRRPCDQDRRSTIVELTPVGRAAIEHAAPGHVAAARTFVFDHLSEADIATLTVIFQRLLDHLTAERTPGATPDASASPSQ